MGTHAFLAYQNLFGLRWDAAAPRTVDPDFVHAGKNVSLEMGFIPVMRGTTYKKPDEPDFDLNLLTTFGRGGVQPLFVPALNLSIQPLKFIEFPLEAPRRPRCCTATDRWW